jgi:hypothetical protein
MSITSASVVVSSDPTLANTGSNPISWDVGDLAPGASGLITVTGVLSDGIAAGPLTNTVEIDSSTPGLADVDTSDNSDTAVANVANLAPAAEDDTATVDANADVLIDVLNNDSDPNNDLLSVDEVSTPDNGTAAIEGTSVRYTPTADFSGTDVFSYTISDTGGLTATAMVTVTINSTNQAPVAADDTASTVQDTPVDIAVLDNDSDPDGDTLSIIAVGDAITGTTAIDGTSITYTPAAGFLGTDVFTYTISDGDLTDSATVTVIVGSEDDTTPPEPPVIGDGTSIITTTDSTPVITGTAEPGSTITMTIELEDGSTLVYETTADANGNWSIDTGSDTPVSGTLPEGGLPPGQYTVTVTATDAAGNESEPTMFTLVIEGSTADIPTVYLPLVVR